jgi:hypothetical protein
VLVYVGYYCYPTLNENACFAEKLFYEKFAERFSELPKSKTAWFQPERPYYLYRTSHKKLVELPFLNVTSKTRPTKTNADREIPR